MDDYHFLSKMGIEVRLPNRIFSHDIYNYDSPYKGMSWAERRREKLLDKIRHVRVIRNWIILVVLRIVGFLGSFFVAGLVMGFFLHLDGANRNGGKIGIIGAEVFIICGFLVFWLTSWIETDQDNIKVNRKRRR